jgi:TPR repeat protein
MTQDSGSLLILALIVLAFAAWYFLNEKRHRDALSAAAKRNEALKKKAEIYDKKWRPGAESGDVESMLALSRGVDSYTEKCLWLSRAADAGSVEAMMEYADLMSDGRDELAFAYYLKAANAGVPRAMVEVAKRYSNGVGVLKNIGSSAEWREEAAKMGHRASQVELAKALFRGHGLPSEPAEGLAWLYLAEHNKALEAGLLVAEFESIARSYPSTTPNRIILDAQNRAKELLAEYPSALSGL